MLPPTIAFATGLCFEASWGVLGAYSAPPNPLVGLQLRGKGKGGERKRVGMREIKASDGFRRREEERIGTQGRGRREEGAPPQTSAINPLVSLSVGL